MKKDFLLEARKKSGPNSDTCLRKVKYTVKSEAKKAKKDVFKKGRGRTSVYACGNHYHLTSQLHQY